MADRWEIINPHDKAHIGGDDIDAVLVAIVGLGAGKYGAERERDGLHVPMIAFADEKAVDGWCAQHTGYATFDALLASVSRSAVADVLDSLTYAHERSSLVDMNAKAEALSKSLRAQVANV